VPWMWPEPEIFHKDRMLARCSLGFGVRHHEPQTRKRCVSSGFEVPDPELDKQLSASRHRCNRDPLRLRTLQA
jgi:hypothetical protein